MYSDLEIIQKALQEPEHFKELVLRYENPLLFFIKRIGQFSEEDAQDIIQETFITVWKYLRGYNPKYSFKAWIYRIARQQTIQHFRKSKSQPATINMEDNPALIEELASDLSVEKTFDQKLLSEHINTALQTLPEQARTAIILRYMEDMSYEEISDTLQKPLGSIATLVYRAKEQLKSYLTKIII